MIQDQNVFHEVSFPPLYSLCNVDYIVSNVQLNSRKISYVVTGNFNGSILVFYERSFPEVLILL